MGTRTNRPAPHSARHAVLAAFAARPYFSTVRLADETGIDPAQARAIVDALDGAGHIRRDDGLAWTLTASGHEQLQRTRRRRAWAPLRSHRRLWGTRRA